MANPATTTISILPASNGTAAVTSGVTTGDPGREVIVTAYPNPGYEFVGFEITRPQVQFTQVPVGGFSTDVLAMCGNGNDIPSQTQIFRVIYTDGSKYYQDAYGVTPVANGLYGAGGNDYLQIFNGQLVGKYTCITAQQTYSPPVSYGGGGGAKTTYVIDSTGMSTTKEDLSNNVF